MIIFLTILLYFLIMMIISFGYIYLNYQELKYESLDVLHIKIFLIGLGWPITIPILIIGFIFKYFVDKVFDHLSRNDKE